MLVGGSISYPAGASSVEANDSESREAVAIGKRLAEDELRRLMVRYQDGDSQAADALIQQLSPRLLRFLAGAYLQSSEAEDLLQDCWIRIHRARHTYRPTEPLLPWIFAIARHARLDAYRKRRRMANREVLVASVPERSAQPEGSTDVHALGVLSLLDRLPENQREAVVMLKVVGMSLEEVAQATASTVGAVKQRAHRAYLSLRQMLEGKQ
jgi:RNA polymerase sigma-70 factor, ECF subfamily